MFGSLFINQINGVELAKPLLIYGMPSVNDVHRGTPRSKTEGFGSRQATPKDEASSSNEAEPSAPSSRNPWLQLESTSRFYIANKWNGVNLTVYKYHNERGHQFLTVMPRGQAILRPSSGPRGNPALTEIYNLLCDMLQIPRDHNGMATVQGGCTEALRNVFPLLQQPEIQSVTYELCGNLLPQLVKYDFDVKLQPLLATTYDGTIIPAALLSSKVIPTQDLPSGSSIDQLTTEWLKEDSSVLSGEFGPFDYDSLLLAAFSSKYRAKALALNQAFRAAHGLPDGYRTGNFILEGKVVFLLNDFNGTASRTSIYKMKPADTSRSHAEMFDVSMQTHLFEALEKLYNKGLTLNAETLRSEMDMSPRLWLKFGEKLMETARNRPCPTLASLRPTPKLLVIMGLPGSGKSTIANKLTQVGWVRVNQDEMGNRKAVEASARTALTKGQNVIVDRCNFDYDQRAHFLELAHKAGVRDVRCLWLDTPAEVCKLRVSVRKDHPTIPEGDAGVAIIDKFSTSMVPPMPGEGFCQIVRAATDEEVQTAFETFAKLLLAS